ncbi:ferric reductase NAD binding domain-containing protein [Trametes meyenii]|nr:ferric reductase NAD binding domain-containing protein [Trametes meyenii]
MSQHGHDSGASPTSALASVAGNVIAAVSASASAGHASATVKVKHKKPRLEYIWYGILGLLALATLLNAVYLAWATLRRYRARHGKSTSSHRPTGKVALRRLPQAVVSGSRIVSFRMRIPYIDMTLFELVLTMVYIGGCLAWCLTPTDGLLPRNNLLPGTWGGKTGIVAAGHIPLAVLLALKNNPITWLTGLGHEKLVLMHRIVSRVLFLMTWLHLVGEYFRSLPKLLNAGWKVAGLVGAIAQTITTIFGIKQIRHRYYEVFYSTHVLLILVFIISVHYHCVGAKYDRYVWPVWVLWGFDRILRGSRYLLFNVILKPKNPKALIEHLGSDGLRVTLKRRMPGGWKAGQHVFLAFPKLGIESHPFTIGNVYEKEENGEAEMVFIIRAMGGQTRMLIDRAMPSGSCEMTSLFDGPYGHPEDIRPFTTCVFIAGGTGVTYTIARMHQLFKDVHASNACAKRVAFIWAVRTETEYEWISADLAKVVALAPSSISLSVEIFLTGARRDTDAQALPVFDKGFEDAEKGLAPLSTVSSSERKSGTESCNEKCEAGSSTQGSGACTPTKSGVSTPTAAVATVGIEGAFPCMSRRSGRPDVSRILEEEISASEGAVAVDVSGPDGLVDAVRSSLCGSFVGLMATLKGTPTVLLSVEQFRM